MILGKPVEKLIDFIGEFLAMGTLVLIVVLYFNNKLGFIPQDRIDYWTQVREYAIVAVVGLKALEFALKRNIFIAVICIAVILAAVVLVMIPGTIPLTVKSMLSGVGYFTAV